MTLLIHLFALSSKSVGRVWSISIFLRHNSWIISLVLIKHSDTNFNGSKTKHSALSKPLFVLLILLILLGNFKVSDLMFHKSPNTFLKLFSYVKSFILVFISNSAVGNWSKIIWLFQVYVVNLKSWLSNTCSNCVAILMRFWTCSPDFKKSSMSKSLSTDSVMNFENSFYWYFALCFREKFAMQDESFLPKI